MNGTPDISLISMVLVFILMIIPVIMDRYLKLGILRRLFLSTGRMTIQLVLVGLYLTYLFKLNNPLVTLAWFLVMILFAVFSVVNNCELSWRRLFFPTAFALIMVAGSMLAYFNTLIVDLEYALEAKFVIAIGGMLLGNAMRGIILGLNDFYSSVRRDENRYLYSLALGATLFEANVHYLRKSMLLALKPALASMATMGIVFLPGMMTGQIIGGSSPLVAIKYQIAIMIIITVTTIASISLTIMLTMRFSYDEYGLLRREIFIRKK